MVQHVGIMVGVGVSVGVSVRVGVGVSVGGTGEGATYLQGIGDDRVRRVCDRVRQWLYGSAVSQ